MCVAKDGGDFIAPWTFHICEAGVGTLHQVLLLVFPLLFWRGMTEFLSEKHVLTGRSSLPEWRQPECLKNKDILLVCTIITHKEVNLFIQHIIHIQIFPRVLKMFIIAFSFLPQSKIP